MKKNLLFALALLLIAISIEGCSMRCPDAAYPILRLSGFDSTEKSVVVLKKYKPVGTLLSVDTINFNLTNEYNIGLDNEWTIEVPAANKAYILTNIKYEKKYSGGERCTEYIGYMVNGKQYHSPRIGIVKSY